MMKKKSGGNMNDRINDAVSSIRAARRYDAYSWFRVRINYILPYLDYCDHKLLGELATAAERMVKSNANGDFGYCGMAEEVGKLREHIQELEFQKSGIMFIPPEGYKHVIEIESVAPSDQENWGKDSGKLSRLRKSLEKKRPDLNKYIREIVAECNDAYGSYGPYNNLKFNMLGLSCSLYDLRPHRFEDYDKSQRRVETATAIFGKLTNGIELTEFLTELADAVEIMIRRNAGEMLWLVEELRRPLDKKDTRKRIQRLLPEIQRMLPEKRKRDGERGRAASKAVVVARRVVGMKQ